MARNKQVLFTDSTRLEVTAIDVDELSWLVYQIVPFFMLIMTKKGSKKC